MEKKRHTNIQNMFNDKKQVGNTFLSEMKVYIKQWNRFNNENNGREHKDHMQNHKEMNLIYYMLGFYISLKSINE
jgi:hypothetical protein